MLTPAEAETLILTAIAPLPGEDCPLTGANGRILRIGVQADRDLPPFDRVTLDGYALRAAALAAGTRRFSVEALQAAGMIARTLGPDPEACVEVMTGAVLPAGADCVVPYEETTRDGAAVTISGGAFPAGHAVHRRGSDRLAGAEILAAGCRLGGCEIAVAAACGRSSLTVAALPRIAVVATGDELVEIDMPVGPHQVRRSNDYALRAALIAAGYPAVERFHLRDLRHEIEHRLWHILAEFDAVVLCGGVSKGKVDHLPAVLEDLGVRKVFHGVAQRPGKPLWFGSSPRRTPVFALPGNPVSSYVCLHRYVLPALGHASGLTLRPPFPVALARAVRLTPALTTFLPVRLESGPSAERTAQPAGGNTSGDFAALVGTDGFVELPPGPGELPAGQVAPFRAWAGSSSPM